MHARKTIAALLASAFALTAGANSPAIADSTGAPAVHLLPSPSAHQKSEFVAQARRAGLTASQATHLQSRVNGYLKRLGGTQVAINKIVLGKKDILLLALPGEKRARDLSISPKPLPAAANTCHYGYFCAYSSTNFYGDAINMYSCAVYSITWVTRGSWSNNQSKGTKAKMYSYSGGVVYTTPGAPYVATNGNWNGIGAVQNC
ncbi:MAG: hypothetical protein JWN52_2332 [Actinomycetia bacterium]|jgi:hypothetical protein|nr:hypothetical protein [Actinomycetes bacterium]